MAFRGIFAVMRAKRRHQSLKDDSLSELVVVMSSSVLLVAPSGTGASGVLLAKGNGSLLK